ncbi:acyl-CoA N-acyltransferase [Lophiotrema nucula]|uniref:Acyl-CoA N-acyltransferase n=1 Tax=Lophiotrema nucula TaxID=690887 RepID=A0A6A5ZBR0_9PLEO|nr:acyl-CoA N-acyltransferase [Lophiotrema nucula]
MATKPKSKRFLPHELLLTPATDADLLSLSQGYYNAFEESWFDFIEPHPLRPSDDSLRAFRFAERMKPWIREPHTRFTVVKLSPAASEYDAKNPDRVIGHAGWILPAHTKTSIVNFWRRDASDLLSWREKMGWTKEYEDELWSGTDVEALDTKTFAPFDKTREAYLGGVGHWHLAPLWVVPEFQGRGVGSLLIKDGIRLAEEAEEKPVMYLEALADARPVYAHFGYEAVKGPGSANVMIKNAPEHVETMTEEEWTAEQEEKRKGIEQS